jgi:DNA-binding Xre family transcriptional regulator
MAIRVKLDHLLLDRRLTLTDLADRIGITIANLSVLKTNKGANRASCWSGRGTKRKVLPAKP